MSEDSRGTLNDVPVRMSLNRHITLFGGERTLVIIALGVTVYFAFLFTMAYGMLIGASVAIVFWCVAIAVLTRMGKADMQMSAVYRRHLRYKKFYSANGRLNAPPQKMDGFTRLR